ncbi:ejaculatory bulb-specific protein 3-like [Pieris napi]|uniref:ejaculatory bulb-specific protein 3-like n=1 Tax=Pieris napi TaxID=78633 RepID=UPI001FB922A2|nr:ejaculatory bulb-specific protein 3-like [Pieris napi]
MRIFIILSLVALAVADITYFTTADDNIDLDTLMKNSELVKWHMDCFVDRRPCEPFSQSYKDNMVEAVSTACRRCTLAQKNRWNKFLSGLKRDYPWEYEAFQKKYDPDNIYMVTFENAVADY